MSEVITADRDGTRAKGEQDMPKGKESSGKSPWKIDVDVYLAAPGTVPPFHLETCLPIDPNGNIVFYNCERPGFEISFLLHDELNPGYSFPNPPSPPNQGLKWALWSREGPGCPPPNYGLQWPQFTSINVKDRGKTLVVRNLNDSPAEFGYTLRVTKDDGATFLDLDPGGTNQNGSGAVKD